MQIPVKDNSVDDTSPTLPPTPKNTRIAASSVVNKCKYPFITNCLAIAHIYVSTAWGHSTERRLDTQGSCNGHHWLYDLQSRAHSTSYTRGRRQTGQAGWTDVGLTWKTAPMMSILPMTMSTGSLACIWPMGVVLSLLYRAPCGRGEGYYGSQLLYQITSSNNIISIAHHTDCQILHIHAIRHFNLALYTHNKQLS